MTPAEEDRLALNMALATPEGKAEVQRATELLDEEIRRSRFNRERAEQVFLFVIDHCVYRYFKGMGVGSKSAVLFPKQIREVFAKELCEEYVQSRGGIKDQRPVRRGLMAYLLGK